MGNRNAVSISVDKSPSGQLQVSITDAYGGYRLAGPKYNGFSKNLLLKELTPRDAKEIIQMLKGMEE